MSCDIGLASIMTRIRKWICVMIAAGLMHWRHWIEATPFNHSISKWTLVITSTRSMIIYPQSLWLMIIYPQITWSMMNMIRCGSTWPSISCVIVHDQMMCILNCLSIKLENIFEYFICFWKCFSAFVFWVFMLKLYFSCFSSKTFSKAFSREAHD